MNFFKSIFSDDPESPEHDNPHESGSNPAVEKHHDDDDDDDDNSSNVWGFEGLIKSIATRSESVIETYRKDLQEFGSGLKKETEVLREVANRAVKDLPTTIEAGASAAREALKSTVDVIAKETAAFAEPDTPETNQGLSSGRYSWFDSQLSAVQSDMSTYCNEPEDVEEYEKWRLGFVLEDRRDEIEGLIGENGALDGVYRRAVPSVVDDETFWCRYFYKVDKLEQQERVRANLVKRAISVDDDEDFSWDVEDEDEGVDENEVQSGVVKVKGGDVVGDKVASDESCDPIGKQEESNSGSRDDEKEGSNLNVDGGNNNVGVEESSKSSENASLGEKDMLSKEVAEVKSDEKVKSEESVEKKNDEKVREEDKGESGMKNDAAVGSSKQAKVEDEEDLEWDEIEDVGSGDEKKSSTAGSTGISNRADLRKRLSVEEDDEDLNWDIEDDDEPVKA